MLGRADKNDEGEARAFAINRRELDARTSVISVEGEVDLSTAPELKWMLLDSSEAGYSRLVLDLSLCRFMDSTALGVLIGVKRSLHAGSSLAIVSQQAGVLRVFELSGLDSAFAIFPTLDAALEQGPESAAQAS